MLIKKVGSSLFTSRIVNTKNQVKEGFSAFEQMRVNFCLFSSTLLNILQKLQDVDGRKKTNLFSSWEFIKLCVGQGLLLNGFFKIALQLFLWASLWSY